MLVHDMLLDDDGMLAQDEQEHNHDDNLHANGDVLQGSSQLEARVPAYELDTWAVRVNIRDTLEDTLAMGDMVVEYAWVVDDMVVEYVVLVLALVWVLA